MIKFIQGDATYPKGNDDKIIVHICNDIGAWGRGFVLAISKRWKNPEWYYKSWYRSKKDFALGKVQFVQVESNIWIANVIGQRNIRPDKNGTAPIRYDAVRIAFQDIVVFTKRHNATVHMPRIGCGLAGGKWGIVSSIIEEEFCQQGISVTVYDF